VVPVEIRRCGRSAPACPKAAGRSYLTGPVQAGEFGRGKRAGLVVSDAGNTRVIYGSSDGLTIRGTCVWAQEALGLRPIKKIEP
jgi:hypothetical protein